MSTEKFMDCVVIIFCFSSSHFLSGLFLFCSALFSMVLYTCEPSDITTARHYNKPECLNSQ